MSRLSSVTTMKVTPNSARGFVFHTVSPSSKMKENNKQVMTYYFEFLQLSFGGDLDLRHSQHSVQSPEFSASTLLFFSNYMKCIVRCALMLFVFKMSTTLYLYGNFCFLFYRKYSALCRYQNHPMQRDLGWTEHLARLLRQASLLPCLCDDLYDDQYCEGFHYTLCNTRNQCCLPWWITNKI